MTLLDAKSREKVNKNLTEVGKNDHAKKCGKGWTLFFVFFCDYLLQVKVKHMFGEDVSMIVF